MGSWWEEVSHQTEFGGPGGHQSGPWTSMYISFGGNFLLLVVEFAVHPFANFRISSGEQLDTHFFENIPAVGCFDHL